MPKPKQPDPPYDGRRDFALGIEEAYRLIRARIAAGGPPWTPKGEGGATVAPLSRKRAGEAR